MGESPQPSTTAFGLSARLLVLVIIFVMIAEVLIYVPSVSRFRQTWLKDKVEKASIAVLAAKASPRQQVGPGLAMDLLLQTGAYAIALKTPERRLLMLRKDMPPAVDVTVDLSATGFLTWIGGAFDTLLHRDPRVVMAIAPVPRHGEGVILEVLLDERPLRADMLGYSSRILQLSIVISLITAGLVFLSLRWLLIRPIRRITDSLIRFHADPEDESVTLPPSRRRDEIGLVQRELRAMQTDLRAALRQKTRLAALGAAVARINHDLRNILSTAMLTSDRLAAIADPEVQRLAPRLVAAIDRAAILCQQTLEFAQGNTDALRPSVFRLADLLAEVEATVGGGSTAGGEVRDFAVLAGEGGEIAVTADRGQLFRVFCNLALNARQAGAGRIRIAARRTGERVVIEAADNGPGIPGHLRPRLFEPFAVTGRNGGSGLGLAIAREIVNAHGGELTVAETGSEGTTFRLDVPASRSPRTQHAA